MARNIGSTFDTILPIAREYHVGAINWGLVAGKSQTYLPWDSWQRPYVTDAARGLAARRLPCRRHALPRARSGDHPQPDQRQIST